MKTQCEVLQTINKFGTAKKYFEAVRLENWLVKYVGSNFRIKSSLSLFFVKLLFPCATKKYLKS